MSDGPEALYSDGGRLNLTDRTSERDFVA